MFSRKIHYCNFTFLDRILCNLFRSIEALLVIVEPTPIKDITGPPKGGVDAEEQAEPKLSNVGIRISLIKETNSSPRTADWLACLLTKYTSPVSSIILLLLFKCIASPVLK